MSSNTGEPCMFVRWFISPIVSRKRRTMTRNKSQALIPSLVDLSYDYFLGFIILLCKNEEIGSDLTFLQHLLDNRFFQLDLITQCIT